VIKKKDIKVYNQKEMDTIDRYPFEIRKHLNSAFQTCGLIIETNLPHDSCYYCNKSGDVLPFPLTKVFAHKDCHEMSQLTKMTVYGVSKPIQTTQECKFIPVSLDSPQTKKRSRELRQSVPTILAPKIQATIDENSGNDIIFKPSRKRIPDDPIKLTSSNLEVEMEGKHDIKWHGQNGRTIQKSRDLQAKKEAEDRRAKLIEKKSAEALERLRIELKEKENTILAQTKELNDRIAKNEIVERDLAERTESLKKWKEIMEMSYSEKLLELSLKETDLNSREQTLITLESIAKCEPFDYHEDIGEFPEISSPPH
jgi:hypothetical protein